MLLVGEVIQRVQSAYSKGVQSKDSRLTERHIYSAAISARSELIRQVSNKNQILSSWITQPLYYVPLEKVATNIANIGIKEISILSSVNKIPKFIPDMDGDLLGVVTTLDTETVFSITSSKAAKYNKGNKYTANKPKGYIRDSRLYITILTSLKAVTLDGIFADPIEVFQFNLNNYLDCPECKCKSAYDIEFPLDENLLTTLVQMASKELIELFVQMSEDTSNNASDDNGTRSMIHQPQDNNG